MNGMKIVQVCPYDMTRPGGVQAHILALRDWMQGRGHQMRIIAPPSLAGAPLPGGVSALGRARQIGLHGTRFEISHASRRDLAATVQELRDWGAQVMHLHTPWTPLMPWQLWRQMGLPSLATFHATLPQTGPDPVAWGLRRAAAMFHRRLGGIVVPSEAPAVQWRAMGLPPDLILPPSPDLAPWRRAGQRAGQEALADVPGGESGGSDHAAPADHPGYQGSSGHPFTCLFLGRFEPRKGAQILPEAWAMIARALPGARLIMAGGGALAPMLHKACADLPRAAIRPRPDDATARKLVAGADLLLAPALHGESFGLVLIEALAAGCLPVAAANPGYATVLTGPGADLLVPPGDAAALARKVIALAQDAEARAALLDWGRARAAALDIAAQGPAFEQLYRDVIAGRHPGTVAKPPEMV